MSYLNWKTWALTALLAPTATFAQVCTPRTPDSSCIVIKNADTGAEIVTAYDSQQCNQQTVNCISPTNKGIIQVSNWPSNISIAYNGVGENFHLTGFDSLGTQFNPTLRKEKNVFTVVNISNWENLVAYAYVGSNSGSSFLYNFSKSVGVSMQKVVAPPATPAPVPAPAPALTYLTFDGYCDEIQFQQIPGSSTFYGTNSPNSCEAGALMFGYVLTGSDNKIHVTLSGGYADAAGNVNALKAVDLELVKADQTDISGNFSAFGIARDAGNRSATQITGQLNGTWKLDTTSRGSKTFATRSAVKPQKSIFSGM